MRILFPWLSPHAHTHTVPTTHTDPTMTTKVFAVFRCVPVAGLDARVMQIDYAEKCFQGRHATYLLLAAGFLVLYVAGVPIAILTILKRRRAALFDHTHADFEATHFAFGTFYKKFDQDFWFFECIVILKKLFMTGVGE